MLSLIKNNPVASAITGLVLVVAVLAFFSYLRGENKREEAVNRDLGAKTERLEANEETLNSVRNAQRPVSDSELERVRNKYDRTRSNAQ